MERSEQITDLIQALGKVQADLRPVAETKENSFGGYQYADLSDVWAVIRPLLSEHGLVVTQFPTSGSTDEIGLTTMLVHAETGQYLQDTVSLSLFKEKGKSRAQVAGSVITYFRRYALSAVLGLTTGEDNDGYMGGAPGRGNRGQGSSGSGNAPNDNGDGEDESEPDLASPSKISKIEEMGVNHYGKKGWPTKKTELAEHVSDGRTDKLGKLFDHEASRIGKGLKKKIEDGKGDADEDVDEAQALIDPDEAREPEKAKADLIAALQIVKEEQTAETASESQQNYVRASLGKLAGGSYDDAKPIMQWLFGVDSSTELSGAQASVIIDWVGAKPDNDYNPVDRALAEGGAILEHLRERAGA